MQIQILIKNDWSMLPQHYVDDKRLLWLTMTIMTWWVIDMLVPDNSERVNTNTHPHTKTCGRSFFIFLPLLTLVSLLSSYPFHYQVMNYSQKYSSKEKKKVSQNVFFLSRESLSCREMTDLTTSLYRENQMYALNFFYLECFSQNESSDMKSKIQSNLHTWSFDENCTCLPKIPYVFLLMEEVQWNLYSNQADLLKNCLLQLDGWNGLHMFICGSIIIFICSCTHKNALYYSFFLFISSLSLSCSRL